MLGCCKIHDNYLNIHNNENTIDIKRHNFAEKQKFLSRLHRVLMAEEYTERLKKKRIERKEIAVFRGRSRECSFFLRGLGALYSGKAARASMRGRSLPSFSRSRRLHPARSRETCHSISLSFASLSLSLFFSLRAFRLIYSFSLRLASHAPVSSRVRAFVRQREDSRRFVSIARFFGKRKDEWKNVR